MMKIDRVYPNKETLIHGAGVTVKPIPKMLAKNNASRNKADWDNTAWYAQMDAHKTMAPPKKAKKPKASQPKEAAEEIEA